jgi:hypothetical protein
VKAKDTVTRIVQDREVERQRRIADAEVKLAEKKARETAVQDASEQFF